MELEKQVCSLESAKKLKELGVKQDSYFDWHECSYSSAGNKRWWLLDHQGDLCILDSCSAFTVAELFELLPPDTTTFKNTKGFRVGLPLTERIKFDDKLFVESAAKMLIYLLENKLI